jgi:hypothetical protein
MTYPLDPTGDMVPILEASIEAVKARHPSGVDMQEPSAQVKLTVHDRCDQCGAAAVYRVAKARTWVEGQTLAAGEDLLKTLDFCLHHWRKNFPPMMPQGWAVIGGNPELLAAMEGAAS